MDSPEWWLCVTSVAGSWAPTVTQRTTNYRSRGHSVSDLSSEKTINICTQSQNKTIQYFVRSHSMAQVMGGSTNPSIKCITHDIGWSIIGLYMQRPPWLTLASPVFMEHTVVAQGSHRGRCMRWVLRRVAYCWLLAGYILVSPVAPLMPSQCCNLKLIKRLPVF